MILIQILGLLLSVAVIVLVCYYSLLLVAEFIMSVFSKKRDNHKCNCLYPWDY
jgi:uncharacterized protein YggT (Ycf19 family)